MSEPDESEDDPAPAPTVIASADDLATIDLEARMIWAMLTKQEDYRTPATATAA